MSLPARTSFMSRHAAVLATIVIGGMALAYTGELHAREKAAEEYSAKAVDHQMGGSSNDALFAVTRPAKNNNVKGGLPQASKWV